MVEYICKSSDEYAEIMKDKKPFMYKHYQSMSHDSFMKLLGILIHFGYRKIPQFRLAWSCQSLCYDPFIAATMARNKFESLLCFLHVVNKDTEEDLKKKKDKLAKVFFVLCVEIVHKKHLNYVVVFYVQVRPLVDHFQKQCKSLHQPNAEISIDERMVKSKARFSFRQYIKNKPTKWGFKLWCLCDSHNGFTNNFTIYRGKEGESLSKNGLGYDVVMNLSSPFLDQGYRIYMDNFYTSP